MGNRPLIWVAVAALALSGCGSGDGKPTIRRLEGGVRVTTGDFKPGGRIPRASACDGAGHPPVLRIRAVPPGARSLLLFMHDPDAPGRDFTHWTVYDIPPAYQYPLGIEGQSDAGKIGYAPPCPPPGDRPHRYVFEVYALRGKPGLSRGASPEDVRAAISRLAFAQGSLVGTYSRR